MSAPMNRIIPFSRDRHAELRLLLPWYVTGRLDPADRARVEAHLPDCQECQAELRQEQRLDVAVSGLQLDVERGWADMRRRMDPAPSWRARLIAGLQAATMPGRLGWVLAAQFVLVLCGTLLVLTQRPAEYHTLGSPPPARAGDVLVVFRPETPESEFRQVLAQSGARLVDGPTSAGAYVLSVPPADRPASLAALRRHPQVVMAEPIDPDSRP